VRPYGVGTDMSALDVGAVDLDVPTGVVGRFVSGGGPGVLIPWPANGTGDRPVGGV
jgi:hypothetical protein